MNCIYKITSPTDKIYIGSTTDFKNRVYKYRRCLCKDQTRLYNSIKKYGFDNHILEIIEECDEFLLNERERYWQEHYNVLSKNGLNCLYVETTSKKRKLSNKTKNKIRLANLGEKNSMYGKTHTKEARDKISKSNKGRINSEINNINQSKMMIGNELSPLKRKVINTETMEIYNSINIASIKNNINYNTLKKYLSGALKNKTNLIYFIDDYREDNL